MTKHSPTPEQIEAWWSERTALKHELMWMIVRQHTRNATQKELHELVVGHLGSIRDSLPCDPEDFIQGYMADFWPKF